MFLKNNPAPEVGIPVNTGIEPVWAWYTFIALLLVCMAISIWYSDDR